MDGDARARGRIASSPTKATATRAAVGCSVADTSRTPFPSAPINRRAVLLDRVAHWPLTRRSMPVAALVERCINRLKQWRGLATRYEKRAVNYRAMVVIASIVIWLESSCIR